MLHPIDSKYQIDLFWFSQSIFNLLLKQYLQEPFSDIEIE